MGNAVDGYGRRQITTWLYRSLAENKPYNQFVRELINPGQESDGFIRGIKWRGRVNASQVREVQFAQNVSQVFLGANLKCASCHDSFIVPGRVRFLGTPGRRWGGHWEPPWVQNWLRRITWSSA